jgi:hypothetical protein
MKRLLLSVALSLALSSTALAWGQWFILDTQFQPYATHIVAGPFDAYADCARVASGMYEYNHGFSCVTR